MTTLTQFPAPFRMGGKLLWEQFEIENFKRGLIGLDPSIGMIANRLYS
jgi:hypothetical protein